MTQEQLDIRREGRRWTREESERRMRETPEKIEFVRGIFAGEARRFTVLGCSSKTSASTVRFGH